MYRGRGRRGGGRGGRLPAPANARGGRSFSWTRTEPVKPPPAQPVPQRVRPRPADPPPPQPAAPRAGVPAGAAATGGYVKRRSHQLLRVSPRAPEQPSQPPARPATSSPIRQPARQPLARQGRHKLVRQGSLVSAAAKALATPKPASSSRWVRQPSAPAASRPPAARGRGPRRGGGWQQLQQRRGDPLAPRRPAGVTKPAKLLRIRGGMYRLARGGHSLRRQATPAQLRTAAAAARAVITPQRQARRTPPAAAQLLPRPGSAARLRLLQLRRLRHVTLGGISGGSLASAAAAAAASNPKTNPKGQQRQRSVFAQLRQRAKFVNSPCLDFCRTGRCAKRAGGGCLKVHDPTRVAVCPRWLAGSCAAVEGCPLQHRAERDLMPLCLHYARGSCSTRDCPYLHIRHAAATPHCQAFAEGHCPKGAACPNRHLTARMLRAGGSQAGGQQAAGSKRRRGAAGKSGGNGGGNEAPVAKRRAFRWDASSQTAAAAAAAAAEEESAALRPEFLRNLL